MTPVLVGIGQTRFTQRATASAGALAARAIVAALRDARVRLEEVDGVVRFDREAAWEYDLPGLMRLRALTYHGAVPDSSGSGPALVRLAAMAVSQEMAGVVVGYHARSEPRPAVSEEVLAAAGLRRDARRRAPRAAGGCAFVVGALVGARWRGPVRILGSMQAAIPNAARHLESWLASRHDEVVRAAARAMLREAGLRPEDIAVACLYGHPTALVDLARDDFGLGDGPRVNPHAGEPSDAALDGVSDVLEAVRQLRGQATRQVAGARVALVAGSPLEPTSAVLLGPG